MAQNADEDAKIEIETTPNPISDPKSSTKSKERKNRKEKVKALAKVSQSILCLSKNDAFETCLFSRLKPR